MAKPTPPTATTPRAARTRAALFDAGMKLLARTSVDAISIDELVATAGVAKGSFFNHFEDKNAFSAALFAAVRGELEADVERANAGIKEPLARLSGGMIVAAAFALSKPKRFAVMVRTARAMTFSDHPLNAGVAQDLRACARARLIRTDTQRSAIAFWIGCCQTLMIAIIEQRAALERTLDLLADMLTLSLTGLGAPEAAIRQLVDKANLRDKLREAMA